MSNLADYYRDLLNWEGMPFQPLVEVWPADLIDEIKTDFVAAVEASNIKHVLVPLGIAVPINPSEISWKSSPSASLNRTREPLRSRAVPVPVIPTEF